MKVLHRSEDRGVGEHGWLSTRYSFSFNTWYEPTRMGFGLLRVLNDDWIAPGAGFPPHGHRDMEIITIVTSGAVAHTDSTGAQGVTKAGEVQVMSAGSGVQHAEYNASDAEPLTLFQLWIETAEMDVEPRYESKSFSDETLLVAPLGNEDGALGIHQNAYVSRITLQKDEEYSYALHDAQQNGVYVFVVEGDIVVEEESLGTRDAIGISEVSGIQVKGTTESTVLLIEVPMQ